MRARYPCPRLLPQRWLMTDERMGERALWRAVTRMAPGSGIIFRHHATPQAQRRALFVRVRRVARARGLVLVAAAPPLPALRHGRVRGAFSWPAHDRGEARAAERAGARVLLVSPVRTTRSHPGAEALGPVRAVRIGRGLGLPMIALGGMDERQWRRIRRLGFAGWAGIDAFGR